MSSFWIDKWLNDSDRNIRIIMEEINNLDEDQLNYLSHIQRCTIIQIMTNLAKLNKRMLGTLESGRTGNSVIKQFRIHKVKMLVLKYSGIHRCHKTNTSMNRNHLFALLEDQQQKLKTLITQLSETDLNGIPGKGILFRILKMNVGETIEYLMYCQWQHIVQARRIRMLQ